ncbi:hypothetical protein HPB52_023918 [Rhipicephalus sanguineus]|uniref:Uncharacterized protein n=1 Tax=Rhipicephalus sanguineus TaxID=34632 RepID=A0A9D4Q7Y1_RHISA|nr:hypothetical protein HPB52_023918 [Rhipicephalus sanguineus]
MPDFSLCGLWEAPRRKVDGQHQEAQWWTGGWVLVGMGVPPPCACLCVWGTQESGALMAGGAGREDDWQMPCLEPSPERRSVRSAAKRWGPRSPEMPMLVPAGPAEEAEEVVSRQTQLLLSRFQGSVEVDSIDGLDFFSFSSVEDLNEFARSMDQLLEEQYHEPRSPDESVPSSVARSGAADEEWRETDWTEERQPVVVLPRKTTDITKIKGWRRKAFGPDQTADQAADHTTRWVMDQMNEQAWRQEEEEKQEPPALMTRRATAAAAAAAAAASGGQQSASNQAAPQPEARIMIDKVKQENVQAAEVSLSKGVRCAFLSAKLDEFLQHQSELRVGQLAQFNPNILPLPEGQGVLALRNPVLASQPPEGASRQLVVRCVCIRTASLSVPAARQEMDDGNGKRKRKTITIEQKAAMLKAVESSVKKKKLPKISA